MIDEIIEESNINRIRLQGFQLVNDKEVSLLRVKEENFLEKKSYIRNMLIMIGNEIITTNYADTRLLLSEFKLFDRGNKQNKYTSLEKFEGNINLKIKLANTTVYISKAEALTIVDIYNESKLGISMNRIIEKEFRFTAEELTIKLQNSKFLDLEL